MNTSIPLKVLMLVVALLCYGARPAVAQRTWIVDADNRIGTDFTDIPPAITAAAPGDIIRVLIPTANGYQGWSYHSPAADITKPLWILGEVGPIPPRVGGYWSVRSIPVGATFLLANIEIVSGGFFFPGGIVGSLSPGTVAIDSVKLTQPSGVGGITINDCGLCVVSHCNLDTHRGIVCGRSTVMVDDSTIHCHNYPAAGTTSSPDGQIYSVSISEEGRGGTEAVNAFQSTVLVSNSTLIGASATIPTYGLLAKSGVSVQSGSVTIAKGCSVFAGSYYGGGVTDLNGGPLFNPGSTLTVDPATVINSLWRPDLVQSFASASQNGLRWLESPTSLQVAHFATPLSVCVLAIGAVATPWSTTIGLTLGPVCIDPASYSDYWDLAGATGVITRAFGIPPGLPVGYQVALQCFELMPSGTINTSNAAVVQIRP